MFRYADKQAGRQLFGLAEIGIQTRFEGFPFQRHNTLITFALTRRNRDDHKAFADHIVETGTGRHIAVHTGDAAHLLAVVAVDHCETDRAVALDLNGDIPFKFQGCGQQAGADQQFTEQAADRLRVMMIIQDLL